ncbi:serine hydrolase [Psychroflexus gondwanensis]|uniref:serine hydrolase n=1 Tax=Psychroflexus gondwanensis TaxID=251 RepID=UPI0011BE7522|nr:serine hydrolase [Psychroflexus gondwanensis]TXE16332.1 serine hydrolase [Psychroflexus gondwanensis]
MKTTNYASKVLMLCICLLVTLSSIAQSLEQQFDTYIGDQYTSDAPGVSILVAKDGKAIYSRGSGIANLELDIKAAPKHVFEIGSITKQFTAVAILMLEEQGKLSVEDEITKFIPDYPTQDKTITVHHLLNHTSGIKSYTNMPSFMEFARTDMTPTVLMGRFKNEQMEFDPGTQFNYNNSGYIVLGHIIEVVSGQSYEDFIQTNIFDKVGMDNSYYGSMTRLIPNRARGYSKTETGYRNADYLSLTLPYAAGSIMSTTADLLKWQNAISANTLIKKSSLEKATNGSTLDSGEEITYGYGWYTGNINGSASVEHDGGIFGYSSSGIFLPEENVYVIGLSNCDCGDVGALVSNVAAMAIGKPFPKKKDAIDLSESQLSKWVGAYEYEGAIRHVTLKNKQLFSQREGSISMEIYPMSATNFIFDGGNTSYDFFTENGNRMVTMTVNGKEMIGKGIDKAPPAERKEIQLDEDVLSEYVGSYELQPGFNMVFSVRDNKLYGAATGQGEVHLFAEEKDKFFLKVVVADIHFTRNGEGKVESLTLFQNGQEMLGKKVQ